MPRVWYFPRWRNLLMQAIMWLVLGGAVALASLLDQHLRSAQLLTLSSPIVDGPVSFRFPAGWKSWTRRPAGDATAHVASDSTDGVSRVLIVSRQLLPCPMAPAEYILRASSLAGDLNTSEFKGVKIDGWPGQTISYAGRRISLGSGAELQFTICSAVILPGREAIMVRLDKNAQFEPSDERLYRQILDEVHTTTTRPSEGGTLSVTDGITVDVPSELNVYGQPDALSETRTAAALSDAGGWISAQFIPVAVSGTGPTLSLLGGLAARERLDPHNPSLADRWFTADISSSGPNQWTIDPKDPSNDIITGHRVAHLVTGNGDRGLVVLLTAFPPAGGSDLDHIWDELVASIHIAKSPPLDQALQAGAALIHATPAPSPTNSCWLWSRGSTAVGFTRGFVSRAPKSFLRYTVRRNWNGTVTAVTQQWGTGSDSVPWASMIRSDAEINVDDPLVFLFGQTTTVSDWITTILRYRDGRESSNNVRFSPPAFVSSEDLPDLLLHVGKTPTAFWSDRFVGVEAELFPAPLLVVAHRVEDVNRLRCVEATVNGAGELSRWYFAPDGSVDHADFASDLHLRPCSESEIETTFGGDRRLTAQPR
jgi:hypothetical protein